MGAIWFGLLAVALVVGAIRGDVAGFTKGALDGATQAVTLAIGLVGAMALWLGLLRVAEESGLVTAIARAVRPLMRRLFPEVPPDHPAMSAITLNMAANMLGLGNAATPMGIKAMEELQKLNDRPDTATNPMALFLAINTSSIQLVPATVVALRAGAGSANPTDIVGPTLVATIVSTAVAITAAKLLARRRAARSATGGSGPGLGPGSGLGSGSSAGGMSAGTGTGTGMGAGAGSGSDSGGDR